VRCPAGPKAAIEPLERRLHVDDARKSVGHSAGGFARVALAAQAPPGLVLST